MKLSSLIVILAASLAAAPAHASPSRGTMLAFPIVQPGTAVMFSDLEFRGKEITDVLVTADGGNIDCLVLNDRGAIVGRDEGPANRCTIKVTPPKTGKYTVLVTNVDSSKAAKALVAIQ